MTYEFTAVTIPFVVALTVTTVLWVRLFRHRDRRAAKGFLLDVTGIIGLAVVMILKLAATDFQTKLFWWNLRFLVVPFMSIGYMLMAIEYTDNEHLLDWRVGAGLAVVVVGTQVAAWTNGTDGLFYTAAGLQNGFLVPEFGPLYWVYATVMVGCLSVGVVLLLRLFRVRQGFRVQTVILVGTISLVLVSAVVWWLRIVPIDILALASTLKVFGFYVAVNRLQLLETLPVARTTVLQNMEDAVFVLNENGVIVDVNPAANALVDDRRVTGQSIDDVLDVDLATELRGSTVDANATDGTATDANANDGTARGDGAFGSWSAAVDGGRSLGDGSAATESPEGAGGESETLELANREVVLERDGETGVYDLEVSRFPDRSGAIAVFRDITERRNREREITVLNRIVRHDIRNEMNVLYGHGQQLEPYLDDDAKDDYELVMESAQHVVDITQTVRELMESITAGESMTRHPMSLPGVLEAEVAKVQSNFSEATFHLESVPDVDVQGNEMLSSVFTNLLNNAVIHNDHAEPTVWVDAVVDGDVARITVADDGDGVPPEHREEIFGRGEKGLASEGTGVGLYLVDTLTSEFEGDVWVEESEAGGAAFVVELQVVDGSVLDAD